MKKYGFVFRPGSLWIGVHYSEYNKRYCMNILPCCTFWWIEKGGTVPQTYNVETVNV